MEIIRQKAKETRIAFPLITSAGSDYFTGTAWGSLTNATALIISWSDSQDVTSATLSNTPIEIANTGEWFITCTSGEMNPNSGNDDYVLLKFNADEIQEQTILIHLIGYQLRAVFDNNNYINGIAGTKNTFDDLTDITSATVYNAAVSAIESENVINTTQLAQVSADIVTEINVNETKIDNIQTTVDSTETKVDVLTADINDIKTNGVELNAAGITDVQTAINNIQPISANIVQVDGNNVNIEDFKNTNTEIFNMATSALNTYDPPTRTELTSDKNEIIAELNANETKINAVSANTSLIPTLATTLQLAQVSADIATEINVNETKIDNIQTTVDDIETKVDVLTADTSIIDTLATTLQLAQVSADIVVEINANETKIDNIQTTIDDIETKVDEITADVNTIIIDTNEIQNKLPLDGGNIAGENDIASILQNTRFAAAVPTIVIVPVSGSQVYRIKAFFYNTSGTMEDPDSNELAIEANSVRQVSVLREFFDDISATTPATSSSTFGGDYYLMTRLGVGVYEINYKFVTSAFVLPDQILFDFALKENTVELHYGRTTTLFDEEPGAAQLADSEFNKNVIAKAIRSYDADSNIGSVVGGSIEDSLNDVINAARDDILTSGNEGWITADVSNLATTTQLLTSSNNIINTINSVETNLESEINANETKIDNIQTTVNQISADTYIIDTLATTTQLAQVSAAVVGVSAEVIAIDVIADAETALINYGVAKEISATSNKNEIIAELNTNETKIDSISGDVFDIQTTVDNIETKVDEITADVNYLMNNSLSANIVEVQGVNVTLEEFKNTNSEIYVNSLSAVEYSLSNNNIATETDVQNASAALRDHGNEYWAASASIDETSAGCVLAIRDQFSFSGNNVNVYVADKTNFNDITVAQILSGGIDNTTLQDAMEKLLSFCIGKIEVDGEVLRYFYQNSSTSAFALSGNNTGRIRI